MQLCGGLLCLRPDEWSTHFWSTHFWSTPRLYVTKAISEGDEGKLEAVQLKFNEAGKETWVPCKSVTYEENKDYLCELYSRCGHIVCERGGAV